MERANRESFAGDGDINGNDTVNQTSAIPTNRVMTNRDVDSVTDSGSDESDTDTQDGERRRTELLRPVTKENIHKICGKEVQEIAKTKKEKDSDNDVRSFDCPVCLQTCIHPVQLPCKHIFCFLCVKGVAHRSKKCALCRQEMPADFFQNPRLIRQEDLQKTVCFDDEYQWFYEGRNGWWQYDDRTSQELEVKFKEGGKTFELLIAGFLYVIDLENMVQFRRNDRTRKRKIKRDRTSSSDIKGIAGLKYPHQVSTRPGGDGDESVQATPPVICPPATDNQNDDNLSVLTSPPAPNNTPQTPQTPADSPPSSIPNSHQDLSAHFQHLNLADHSPLHTDDQVRTSQDSGHSNTHFPVLYSDSEDES